MIELEPPVLVAVAVVLVSLLALLFLGGKAPTPFLVEHRRKRVQVPLQERVDISHDTIRLRFALPTSKTALGLPIGNHFKVYCPNAKGVVAGEWNGREDIEADEAEVERKYTPTSLDNQKGSFDLVVKVYKKGVLPQFPDGGKMSQFLDTLQVGQKVDITGPWGKIEYKGNGLFVNSLSKKELQKKHVGMLAGGTGITPMLQIIKAIMGNSSDPTKVSLIYANKTEEDILVREELEALQKANPTRFSLWYTLDKPPASWKYSEGFITADMISDHLPAQSPDVVVLMCGPPPMVEYACKKNLDTLGFPKASQLAF